MLFQTVVNYTSAAIIKLSIQGILILVTFGRNYTDHKIIPVRKWNITYFENFFNCLK